MYWWNWIIQQLLDTSAKKKKEGETISVFCNKLAKDIWNWAKGQDIWVRASHVHGVRNSATDLRSHLLYDNKEWSLNKRVAKPLFDQFGKPEINLFASPLMVGYHVNAFSMCWLNLNSYTFPPVSTVRRVLAKLAQHQATALVIVHHNLYSWWNQGQHRCWYKSINTCSSYQEQTHNTQSAIGSVW